MGEPITLVKGNKTMDVYGRAQAAVHVSDGWQVADKDTAAAIPSLSPSTITKKASTRKRRPRTNKAS